MDAIEYVKQRERMCDYYVNCGDCPAGNYERCASLDEIPNLVPIVEKWTKEHPVKTRQSEFLKIFPHPALDSDGVIAIQPCEVIVDACKDSNDNKRTNCWACRRDFWLKEIE